MKKKKITIEHREYFLTKSMLSYGYDIRCKEANNPKANSVQLFHTYKQELAEEIMNRFMEGEIVISFPDTSKEIPPVRMLVHNTKHSDDYYMVPTLKALKQTCTYIIKKRYVYEDYYWPPEKPENKTGITCAEDLETITFDEIKKEVTAKWNAYQTYLYNYKIELNNWNALLKVVNGDAHADPINVMREFEGDRWELLDPSIITVEDIETIKLLK